MGVKEVIILKGPGIEEYVRRIKELKENARAEQKEYIELSSKALHAEMSQEFATMPTCCQAIYKCMLQGDEILRSPKGKTGFGSHLDVRMYVNEEGREPYFEPKRRGRPPKSEVEKMRIKYRFRKGGNELPLLIKEWLEEKGWQTEEHNKYIEACRDNQRWIIDIYQATRGRKMPLPNKLTDIIKKMEDADAYYSVALVDSPIYRKQWNEIPTAAKERLQVSVLLADRLGHILEMK